jgi:hypothetical protein
MEHLKKKHENFGYPQALGTPQDLGTPHAAGSGRPSEISQGRGICSHSLNGWWKTAMEWF